MSSQNSLIQSFVRRPPTISKQDATRTANVWPCKFGQAQCHRERSSGPNLLSMCCANTSLQFYNSAGSFLMKLADDWHFANGTASSYHKAASRARAAGSGPDYSCFCFPRTCPHPRRFALPELRRANNSIAGKTKLHLLGLYLAIWDSTKCGQRHLCLRGRDK